MNTNDGCVRGSEMESNFKLPEYFVDCVSSNPPKSNSTERPFYSHKIHQSGVNSVSLMERGKSINTCFILLYLCSSKNRNNDL